RSGYLVAVLSAAIAFLAQTQGQIASPQVSLIWNAAIVGIIGCVLAQLLHRTKLADEIEKQLSRIDSATGAINRNFFIELLAAEFNRAERYKFPLTLAHIVLDNLKDLNERLGQDAGDAVLYEFIQTLSQALRANDVVARLSSNEFAVLLPQTNEIQAQQVFTRIEPAIKTSLEMEAIPLTYGIGIASFQVMPDTVEDLLQQTQNILQQNQNNTKNRLAYQVLP
ncbi:MAG: GGDEF domain-containing protein, partial [Thermosynechococcaceae cyanobacterium]